MLGTRALRDYLLDLSNGVILGADFKSLDFPLVNSFSQIINYQTLKNI